MRFWLEVGDTERRRQEWIASEIGCVMCQQDRCIIFMIKREESVHVNVSVTQGFLSVSNEV